MNTTATIINSPPIVRPTIRPTLALPAIQYKFQYLSIMMYIELYIPELLQYSSELSKQSLYPSHLADSSMQ